MPTEEELHDLVPKWRAELIRLGQVRQPSREGYIRAEWLAQRLAGLGIKLRNEGISLRQLGLNKRTAMRRGAVGISTKGPGPVSLRQASAILAKTGNTVETYLDARKQDDGTPWETPIDHGDLLGWIEWKAKQA